MAEIGWKDGEEKEGEEEEKGAGWKTRFWWYAPTYQSSWTPQKGSFKIKENIA